MPTTKTPGVVARASAVLPPAGAFDATATVVNVAQEVTASLWPDYTPGVNGGAFKIAIEVSRDGTTWYPLPITDSTLTVSGTTATQTSYGLVIQYPVTSGTSLLNLLPYRINVADYRLLRVRAAETGVVGTPGTLTITKTGTVQQ